MINEMKKINLILVALALTLMACHTEKTPTYDLQGIESPAKIGSEEPNLFTDSNGDVYLS